MFISAHASTLIELGHIWVSDADPVSTLLHMSRKAVNPWPNSSASRVVILSACQAV